MKLNHAMIYVADVERAKAFYAGALGLVVIEEFPGYTRLRFPSGDATIALHQAEPGRDTRSEGVRLYFEVRNLGARCRALAAKGIAFKQPPKMMPWGWQHAYLDDPDGHEISLYWAGAKRLAGSRPRRAARAVSGRSRSRARSRSSARRRA
jgi:catechol 2,3-dioxygenase-like lactoylglutathione lyase family enzyme